MLTVANKYSHLPPDFFGLRIFDVPYQKNDRDQIIFWTWKNFQLSDQKDGQFLTFRWPSPENNLNLVAFRFEISEILPSPKNNLILVVFSIWNVENSKSEKVR